MMNEPISKMANAGNPHVRFDEGEVALAKPRRGSLLYKNTRFGICGVLSACAALFGLAAWGDDAPYLRLDYIESTAQQYIQTGLKGYEPFTSEFDMMWVAFNSGESFFGGKVAGGQAYNLIRFSGTKLKLNHGSQDNSSDGPAVKTYQRYLVKTDLRKGNSTYKATELFTKENPTESVGKSWKNNANFAASSGCQNLAIFGDSDKSSKVTPAGHNRVYRAKMCNGGNEQRDFIPVLKTEDNTSGLLDVLTGTFYPSGNGVDFVHGPTAELIGIDYVYTDGTLTGLKLTVEAESFARELHVVYGDTNGGDTPSAWTTTELVGEVAANATTIAYSLPDTFGEAGCQVLRFYLTNGTYLEWSKAIAAHTAFAPAYLRLNYLESSCNAAFDTGLYGYDPFFGEIDMEYTKFNKTENIVFGARLGGSSYWYIIRTNSGGTAMQIRHGTQLGTETFTPSVSTRYDVRMNLLPASSSTKQNKTVEFYPHGETTMAGSTVKSNGRIFKSTYTATLFGLPTDKQQPEGHAHVRIYRARLANEGASDQDPQAERRDYVPVKNLATGIPGMYDISGASGTSPFYSSSTGTNFTYTADTYEGTSISFTDGTLTLSFAALESAKTLWVFFADADQGTDASAWTTSIQLAELAAGASQYTYALPSAFGQEGAVVLRFCLVDANGIAEWSPLVDSNRQDPFTAAWTGAGEAGNALDPANWACCDILGRALPSTTLPTAETTCTVTGAQTFAVPTNSAFVCKSLVLNAFAPTAACDLRGLTAPFSGTIELNGQALTLATFSSLTQIKDSSSGDCGVLTLDVSSGETVVNTQTKLLGNFQLVKEGVGTYIPQYGSMAQTYSGGNRIVAGTIMAYANDSSHTYAFGGAEYCTLGKKSDKSLVIEPAGTLDINGELGTRGLLPVLAGGRITNTGTDNASANNGGVGSLTLTADSTIELGNKILMSGPQTDLGGHTLEIKWTTNEKRLYNRNEFQYTNGTIRLNRNGNTLAYFTVSNPADTNLVYDCRSVDFDVNATLAVEVGLRIHDYTCRFDGTLKAHHSNGGVYVHGTFTPVTDKFVGFELQDGGALDLSGRTGAWSTLTANTLDATVSQYRHETGLATFQDDGTFTIKLGSRDLKAEMVDHAVQLITWGAVPENLDKINFVLEPDFSKSREGKWFLLKNETGVKLCCASGTTIIVR